MPQLSRPGSRALRDIAALVLLGLSLLWPALPFWYWAAANPG